MDYMMTPLKMTLAGIRLTGYMIETQCRVAQVLGQAALKANPYRIGAPVVIRGAMPNPVAAKHVAAKPAGTSAITPIKSPKRQPSAPPPMPCGKAPELRPS